MSKWVICASGPSMADVDLGLIRRHRSWRVLAVNCTWKLVPWAAAMYAGDGDWWEAYGAGTANFAGQRWTRDTAAAIKFNLRRVVKREGRGLCRERGAVHLGGNSGYQAINLAYHFGARQIVLLGFDMHRSGGAHWHEDHEGMLNAPASHISVWRREFLPLATDLRDAGVRVVNATEGTALQCFPRVSLAEALRA